MNFKRVILAAAAGAVILSVSGCKSEPAVSVIPDGQTGLDAQAAVQQAAENIERAESLEARVVTSVSITSGTSGVSANKAEQTASIKYIEEPLGFEVIVKADGEDTRETYAIEEDGVVTEYLGFGGDWMKMNVDRETAENDLRSVNVKENLLFLLEYAENPVILDEAGEQGEKIIRVTVSAEKLPQLLEEMKALQAIGMAGLDAKYYDGIDGLEAEIYADSETGDITGYSYDLAPALQKLIDNLMATLAETTGTAAESVFNVGYYINTVSISNIGGVEEILLPEEAENAELYEPSDAGSLLEDNVDIEAGVE